MDQEELIKLGEKVRSGIATEQEKLEFMEMIRNGLSGINDDLRDVISSKE